MAGKHAGKQARRSPLPWVVAAAVALAYLGGWLLGLGTGLPAGKVPAAFNLAFLLLRLICWPLALASIVFLASTAAGAALLRWAGCEPCDPLERLLFAAAAGLGLSAYATLGLGVLGMLDRGIFAGLLLLMLIAGYLPLREALGEAVRTARAWLSAWTRYEWALAAAAVALIALTCLCVAGPVVDYDALEYHLGAPGEYFRDGQVRFLSHNVYAGFPQQVEMLYLLGIVLAGGKFTGMAVAVAMQVLFGALTALAAGALAGRYVRKDAALPAAVFFLTLPMLVLGASKTYVTMALCFYTTLAVTAVLGWLWGGDGDRRARTRYLVLCGICCGLAAAAKYSALLLVCLPIGLAVLGVSVRRVGGGWLRRLAPAALVAACALAAMAPWLVRNLSATGNPVFPLLYDLFGAEGWSAQQAAKFARAHAPPSLRVADMALDAWRFLTGYVGGTHKLYAGPLAVLFIPLLLLPLHAWIAKDEQREAQLRGRPVLFLLGFQAACVVLWAVATHRIARFLAPTLAVLCVLSAGGLCAASARPAARRLLRAVALVGVFWGVYTQACWVYNSGGPGVLFAGDDLPAAIRNRGFPLHAESVRWVNDARNVPRDGVVMLVGEARVYHFDRRVLYAVVFNDHSIEPALAAARTDLAEGVRRLRQSGATHVLVNWLELRRLARSYTFSYGGREQAGCLPQVELAGGQPLRALLDAAGRRVMAYGQMPWPDDDSPGRMPMIEVYDLRRATAPEGSQTPALPAPPGSERTR